MGDAFSKSLSILNYQRNLTHTMCHFLVVNEYDTHLSFHCVKLNKVN